MKIRLILLYLCALGPALTGYSTLLESTTDTFADPSELTAYVPIDGNDSSIQTFLLASTSSDGSHLDASNDGYVRLHRTATVTDTIGMTRSLGTVGVGDVGRMVYVDAAIAVPNSNLTTVWELQLDGAGVDGQGKMIINTFSTGNASGGNSPLQLSSVPLGSVNPQRTASGPLTYTIQTADVGKVLGLRFDLYDGSTAGAEGTRNLHVDAISFAASGGSSATNLWSQFLEAKAAGTEPILPDYSYAGYALGEAGIPAASGTVFDVTNYGAIPDDWQSDRAAIEAAIAAADTNGGGIVFFPPGRFNVNETLGTVSGIEIHGENIILKGSGSGPGGTELFMKKNMDNETMFSFNPAAYPLQNRTTITQDAARESYSITVANASALQPGMLLELTMGANTNANAEFLDGLEPWDIWTTTVTNGVFVRGERHRIKSKAGNVVTFHEPIHCNIIASHGWTVRSSAFVPGWGVEDIHFRGNWQGTFVHHENDTVDYGWQLVSFFYGDSPYIRRCRFTDVSSAVVVSACYAGTILNCSIEGNQGHSSFASGYYSYGTLMAYCADMVSNGAFHGFGANAGSVGTVITHCKNSNRGFDWHASWPYCTLLDACSGGLIGNGGNVDVLPNHMRHLTIWNFNQTAGTVYSEYDWWEPRVGSENYSGAKVVRPIIAGYHGLGTTFKTSSCQVVESHGTPVEQASLYDAQLESRLGNLPIWLDEARARYNFFMANGYWTQEPVAQLLFNDWADGHGLAGSDAETTADPDGDQRDNLFEYAVGGFPVIGTNSPSELPNVGMIDDSGFQGLEYVYARRRNADGLGLAYAVERTDDLLSNVWSTTGVVEAGNGVIDDEFESVTNRISSAGTTNGFVRLKIEM